jgi:hypothetical protein
MIKFNTYLCFGDVYLRVICNNCGSKLVRAKRKDRINYFLEHVCWKCLKIQPDIDLMISSSVDRLDYHFSGGADVKNVV